MTDGAVDGPWTSDVDVRDLTDVELVASREASLTIYDSDGWFLARLGPLSESWDLSVSQATDRAVRLYIAHVCDSRGLDLRLEHDVRYTVPPPGWVREHSGEVRVPIVPASSDTVSTGNRIDSATTPQVRDMVHDIRDEQPRYESVTDVVRDALEWVLIESDGDSQSDTDSQSS